MRCNRNSVGIYFETISFIWLNPLVLGLPNLTSGKILFRWYKRWTPGCNGLKKHFLGDYNKWREMEFFELLIIFCLPASFNCLSLCFKKFPWKIIKISHKIFVLWDLKLLQASILEFIQNLSRFYPEQWVPSFTNIQKQKHMSKNGLLFKKFTNFTHK